MVHHRRRCWRALVALVALVAWVGPVFLLNLGHGWTKWRRHPVAWVAWARLARWSW